jgi:cellulose synthase (UDP-forming)
MNPKALDKYLYIKRTPTWAVRSLYLFGILTWFGVIYGYGRFLSFNLIFLLGIAPIACFLILYHLVSYGINLFYKQFDLEAHQARIRQHALLAAGRPQSSIDIFIPICGEDTSVLRRTFKAVSALSYPEKKVYVLDDRGIGAHERLSESFGFSYLSREDKGHMKKAGNIKHGFERSEGDFIAVFDADFAPHPDFITELLPYMDDPKVAIVQSPQYFETDNEVHGRSHIEYGASHIQEDFYRVIQVARDQLGAPVCCGSNALYRRAALDAIGGTVQIEHSEDMYTGFALLDAGWRVHYVPVILAIGFCPDSLQPFFHQQRRWCSGSLVLMLDKKFWLSRLSFSQKISFISGFMHYLSYPVTLLASFQVFLFLIFYGSSITLRNALPFIPCIIFSYVILRLFRLTRERYGGYVARTASGYSYIHAVWTTFLKQSMGWQPTNTKSAAVSNEYMQQVKFVALYLVLYLVCIGFALHSIVVNLLNINYCVLLFWVFYNLIAIVIVLAELYALVYRTRQTHQPVPVASFWRLKTIGAYSILTGVIMFGVGYLVSPMQYGTAVALADNPGVSVPQNTESNAEFVAPPIAFFSTTVSLGARGTEVLALQQFLNEQGFLVQSKGPGSPGDETSYFGLYTYRALKRFQAAHSLRMTGSLDPQTRAVINSLID